MVAAQADLAAVDQAALFIFDGIARDAKHGAVRAVKEDLDLDGDRLAECTKPMASFSCRTSTPTG